MKLFFNKELNVDNVCTLTFDRQDKDMNILSESVLTELDEILDELKLDSSITGLIFTSGKKDQFIVGADVNEIKAFHTAKEAEVGASKMQGIFTKLSELPFTTVAAIHGNCLGGGLELALACDLRIVSDHPKTQLAVPEIQLGLIPGAGGTQRLPRLIGIQKALDMILTGKRYVAKKALKASLADAMVHPSILQAEALQLLCRKKELVNKRQRSFTQAALDSNPFGRSIVRSKAKEMVDKNTKGFYPAAYKALQAVFSGYEKKLPEGLKLEAEIFGELSQTPESKSLVHLFNCTTVLKKHPYVEAGRERFGEQHVSSIGVVGAGFMGTGIGIVAANKGIRSYISDPSKESISSCLKNSRAYFNKQADRKKIKRFAVDQKMNLISPALSPVGFSNCDVVIEAVFEDVALKQKILQGLEDQKPKENWIFASNTSALPISKIAEQSKFPERIVGMHFFSPVEKMPLLEVVKTKDTAPWVLARVAQLGFDMGKQVIIVDDGPGFYTTRALAFYLAEAATMVAEGIPIDSIDKAMVSYGYPVGPLALVDEVGIDVGIHVLETMCKAFPERLQISEGFLALRAAGYSGKKNGKGFYKYKNNKKDGVNEEVYKIFKLDSSKTKVASREYIQKRCHYIFVNEAIRCLEDKIISTPHDGDIGAVFGLGFPPFQGGPFHFVDQFGHEKFKAELDELVTDLGIRFTPAKKLSENKLFYC